MYSVHFDDILFILEMQSYLYYNLLSEKGTKFHFAGNWLLLIFIVFLLMRGSWTFTTPGTHNPANPDIPVIFERKHKRSLSLPLLFTKFTSYFADVICLFSNADVLSLVSVLYFDKRSQEITKVSTMITKFLQNRYKLIFV